MTHDDPTPPPTSYWSIPHSLNEHLFGVATGPSAALIVVGIALIVAVSTISITLGITMVPTTVSQPRSVQFKPTRLVDCGFLPLGPLDPDTLHASSCAVPPSPPPYPTLSAALELLPSPEPFRCIPGQNISLRFGDQEHHLPISVVASASQTMLLYDDPARQGICDPERFMGSIGDGCRFVNWQWPDALFNVSSSSSSSSIPPNNSAASNSFYWTVSCSTNHISSVAVHYYRFLVDHSDDMYCTATFDPRELLNVDHPAKPLVVSQEDSLSFFDEKSLYFRLFFHLKNALKLSPLVGFTTSLAQQLQQIFADVVSSSSIPRATKAKDIYQLLGLPDASALWLGNTLHLFCNSFCDLYYLLRPNNTVYSPPPELVPANFYFGSPVPFFDFPVDSAQCPSRCTDETTVETLGLLLTRDVGASTDFNTLSDWIESYLVRLLSPSSSALDPVPRLKSNIIDRLQIDCEGKFQVPKSSTELNYDRFTAVMAYFSSLQIILSVFIVTGWGIYRVGKAKLL